MLAGRVSLAVLVSETAMFAIAGSLTAVAVLIEITGVDIAVFPILGSVVERLLSGAEICRAAVVV
jgi:hypothetical protein